MISRKDWTFEEYKRLKSREIANSMENVGWVSVIIKYKTYFNFIRELVHAITIENLFCISETLLEKTVFNLQGYVQARVIDESIQ